MKVKLQKLSSQSFKKKKKTKTKRKLLQILQSTE